MIAAGKSCVHTSVPTEWYLSRSTPSISALSLSTVSPVATEAEDSWESLKSTISSSHASRAALSVSGFGGQTPGGLVSVGCLSSGWVSV